MLYRVNKKLILPSAHQLIVTKSWVSNGNWAIPLDRVHPDDRLIFESRNNRLIWLRLKLPKSFTGIKAEPDDRKPSDNEVLKLAGNGLLIAYERTPVALEKSTVFRASTGHIACILTAYADLLKLTTILGKPKDAGTYFESHMGPLVQTDEKGQGAILIMPMRMKLLDWFVHPGRKRPKGNVKFSWEKV